ncbi:hypothetical protein C8Q76DRAFT_83162 [Earliella scabrosa]|nr:hypothetical protein C8Q76DRAFT_83162 [Earliella scabrosa]
MPVSLGRRRQVLAGESLREHRFGRKSQNEDKEVESDAGGQGEEGAGRPSGIGNMGRRPVRRQVAVRPAKSGSATPRTICSSSTSAHYSLRRAVRSDRPSSVPRACVIQVPAKVRASLPGTGTRTCSQRSRVGLCLQSKLNWRDTTADGLALDDCRSDGNELMKGEQRTTTAAGSDDGRAVDLDHCHNSCQRPDRSTERCRCAVSRCPSPRSSHRTSVMAHTAVHRAASQVYSHWPLS